MTHGKHSFCRSADCRRRAAGLRKPGDTYVPRLGQALQRAPGSSAGRIVLTPPASSGSDCRPQSATVPRRRPGQVRPIGGAPT